MFNHLAKPSDQATAEAFADPRVGDSFHEMAYDEAAVKQAGKVAKARRPAELEGTISRAGLAAVLALVEQDRCMQPRGHVFHPLAPRCGCILGCNSPFQSPAECDYHGVKQ